MTEYSYLRIMQELLLDGNYREGRNGGVYSLFGRQMRFDLSQGFPLLTTKEVAFKQMVDELLWFLRGSTNVNDLPERTQHWWSPWQKADGSLGPIYGEQYRGARWWYEVEQKIFEPEGIPDKGSFAGVGNIGSTASLRGQSDIMKMLKNVWRDMLKRCYDKNSKHYKSYGARGIHVCKDWFSFDNFYKDAQSLPGWEMKLSYPKEYSIDKDIRFASNRYSPETCMWASHKEQSANTSTGTPFTAISPEGNEVLFSSVSETGLNLSAVHRCLKGKLKTHRGWSNFKYFMPEKVIRFREVDQLKRLIAGIKFDPYSRRHMINLWHTPAMDHAQLPCCHGSVIQFYVSDGKLSSHVYQRSADWFLGVPVNIASYALLTHIIARECGLQVGEFVHTFGDVHLYANHRRQAKEQLERTPRAMPSIVILYGSPGWEELEPEHFSLTEYNPYPKIKAPVSK